jgi:hypothetical protein
VDFSSRLLPRSTHPPQMSSESQRRAQALPAHYAAYSRFAANLMGIPAYPFINRHPFINRPYGRGAVNSMPVYAATTEDQAVEEHLRHPRPQSPAAAWKR